MLALVTNIAEQCFNVVAERWSDPSRVLILQDTTCISSSGGLPISFALTSAQTKGILSGAPALSLGSPCYPAKMALWVCVPALGHLSLTASLWTIQDEKVPCGHLGTPLAFKHRARKSLSMHFSGLSLRENSYAQTVEEFMWVTLFREITWLPQCIWYYQRGICFP